MADLPVHDKVFPFACDDIECDRIYYPEDFVEVALLWGFIYFTGNDYQIVGLTCPFCHHTSLKVCQNKVEFSIELLEDIASEKKAEHKIEFSNFVPFSKRILYRSFRHGSGPAPIFTDIDIPPFSKKIPLKTELYSPEFFGEDSKYDVGGKKEFFMPEEVSIFDYISYPKYLVDEIPYAYSLKYLFHLCEIENTQNQVKAIPRIISNYSIYNFSDVWLRSFPRTRLHEGTIDKIFKAFDSAINFKNLSDFFNETLSENELLAYETATNEFLENCQFENPVFVEKLAVFF